MQTYGIDTSGNIIVLYDSRWRTPDLLGYTKDSPQWAELQHLYTQYTGITIDIDGNEEDHDESN